MGDSSAVANDTSVADFDKVRTRFVAYLDASGCSPNTARAYGHDLTHLRFCHRARLGVNTHTIEEALSTVALHTI